MAYAVLNKIEIIDLGWPWRSIQSGTYRL